MVKEIKEESVNHMIRSGSFGIKHYKDKSQNRRMNPQEKLALFIESVKKGYQHYEELQKRNVHKKLFICPYGRKNIKSFFEVQSDANGQRTNVFSRFGDRSSSRVGDCGYTKQKTRTYCCQKCFKQRYDEEQ